MESEEYLHVARRPSLREFLLHESGRMLLKLLVYASLLGVFAMGGAWLAGEEGMVWAVSTAVVLECWWIMGAVIAQLRKMQEVPTSHRIVGALLNTVTLIVVVGGTLQVMQTGSVHPGNDHFLGMPHLDVGPEETLRAGADYALEVFIDQHAARLYERSAAVDLQFPPGTDALVLTARLTASPAHFEPPGEAPQYVTVRRGADMSNKVYFKVRTLPGVQDFTGAGVSVILYSAHQQPVGFVGREWDGSGQPVPLSGGPAPMALVPQGRPADLNVHIFTQANQLWCRVTSPHLASGTYNKVELWNLADPRDRVMRWMKDLMDPNDKNPKVTLDAIGAELYDAVPQVFHTALWELIDQGKLATISLVTDEPHFPWELVCPYRQDAAGQDEIRAPLSTEYVMGRWIVPARAPYAPPQSLSLPMQSTLIIKAPMNKDEDSEANQLAQRESLAVRDFTDGDFITPATELNVDDTLARKSKGILHFICHGRASNPLDALGPDPRQLLLLDSGSRLVDYKLRRMSGFMTFFKRQPSLVFLNACEVGRQEKGLVGVDGFASAFSSLKAGAVIAPLWSVRHRPAHDVAVEFYQKLFKEASVPPQPMARILRDIRARAYQKAVQISPGDVSAEAAAIRQTLGTVMAYCFYGDPHCVRQ